MANSCALLRWDCTCWAVGAPWRCNDLVKCVVLPVRPGMWEQREWHSWGRVLPWLRCVKLHFHLSRVQDHPRLLSSQGSGESTAWEVTACRVIPSFQLRHKKGNIAHVFKQIPGFEVKYRKSHIRCDIWQPFLRAGCWAVRRINDSLKPGLGCGQGLPC